MEAVTLQFESNPKEVRGMVQKLLLYVDTYAPSQQARNDLRLIFSELLYNAVIHGNKENHQKTVYVRLLVKSTRLFVCIKDEGSGFDYKSTLEEARSEDALLSENGRGMMLVQALTENLCFNENGNELSFEMRLT